jgi:hypothetical protein
MFDESDGEVAMGRLGLRALAAAAVIAGLSVMAGCISGESGSRHKLYHDIDDLARDSSAIVVGTVSDQHFEQGELPTTISTVEVTNVPENPQLAGNIEGGVSHIEVGDTVAVRQIGGAGSDAGILTPGHRYLLFLTPSMLEGDAASQYFITGAVAGLYTWDGSQFTRTPSDDTLPDTIQPIGPEG